MDIQDAVDNYVRAIEHCENLILVHRSAGNGGVGRRTTETSINRGTIVLTVAAWQAFVQDVAQALRDEALVELGKVAGARLLAYAMDQWQRDFNSALEKFSTPDAEKSRALLKRVGFDPRPSWTWVQAGGRGNQSVTVQPKHVDEVIKQWLRVRHDIAHGHMTIHSLPILTAVRDPKSSARAKATPALRLTDAIDCLGFFSSVARLTAAEAAKHLAVPAPTWETLPPLKLGLHISHL
ncbi:hypothetical protein [Streptomyces formicae]|uniref:RiboL-PSP-HEPN domain-containing protein n=1 Tax=Streptomyces formicae TaxID=1616117 RepID=A0ABY3WKJ5_9ACTN|nr:hypothetical protein [Streptomyces formicae]UNM13111.1 hypothetical protein J4032_17865 [Streptomyces formicae]